jgi:selenocysteine lyase/cysteine desulfurase
VSHLHANTAAVGLLHPAAEAAMARELAALARPDFYRADYPRLTRQVEATRAQLAGLLGVPPARVALTASTSEALAVFQSSLALRPGDVVACGRGSFVSVSASLLRLQAEGVLVLPVGTEAGLVRPSDLSATPPRTRLVMVDWVNYWSGQRNRVQPLVEWCQMANVPLLLDAVQGLGAVPLDFDLGQVAGLACGGHKWLRGPEGTGFLYVAEWMQPRLAPRHAGYRSLRDPLDLEPAELALSGDARAFEVGTLNTLGFLGLGEAVRHLRAEGPSRRARRTEETITALHHALSLLPDVEVVTPAPPEQRAGILSFRHRRAPAAEIVRRLEARRLTAGSRRGLVRLSPDADVPPGPVLDALVPVLQSL